MIPHHWDLPPHLEGDTWSGFTVGPILVNGLPPVYAATNARIQFTLEEDDTLGYELNTTPGTGIGTLTIVDADLWQFDVPAQVLDMPDGKYNWAFRTTNSNGDIVTYYSGTFNYVGSPIHVG